MKLYVCIKTVWEAYVIGGAGYVEIPKWNVGAVAFFADPPDPKYWKELAEMMPYEE